jgi:hypothetical protein
MEREERARDKKRKTTADDCAIMECSGEELNARHERHFKEFIPRTVRAESWQ